MKIDLLSPESFAAGHPFAQYRWLRENAPVFWHEEPDGRGFWAVTRYKDVREVDRDFQSFSSEPTIMIADPMLEQAGAFGPYKMMLMMDPPQHTAYRRLIRDAFIAPVSAERTPRMNALAKQIVDAVIAKGECDFVAEIAGEMPSYVIAELLGLPLEDGRELYKLTEAIHTAPEAQAPGAGAMAVFQMFDYGRKVMEEKRARPSDDLATKLLQAEVDGKRVGGHGVPAVLPAADRRRRRHHAQSFVLGPDRAPGESGAARLAEGGPAGARGLGAGGIAALDVAGDLYAPDREARHGAGGRADPRRPEGRDVFRLRQPRSGEIRSARCAGPVARAQRAHRLRQPGRMVASASTSPASRSTPS